MESSSKNILKITLHGHTYSLNEFCQMYDFSYATAYRKYKQGLRDQELFDALAEVKYSQYLILDRHFRSLKAAAHFFKVPYSTFLRKYRNGTLNQYLHSSKRKENSS